MAENSQDYVFITNVLWKDSANAEKILAEASRILKPWWQIIVVDDNLKDEFMIKFIKKNI